VISFQRVQYGKEGKEQLHSAENQQALPGQLTKVKVNSDKSQ
jgi:hypothetical protein